MKNKFESIIVEDNEDNDLDMAAAEFNLKVNIPKIDTPAYKRLKNLCEIYADAVANDAYTNKSPNLSTNEKAKQTSGRVRRDAHNQLCTMLYGTSWDNTIKEKRDAASNFAVTVANKPEYVDTF